MRNKKKIALVIGWRVVNVRLQLVYCAYCIKRGLRVNYSLAAGEAVLSPHYPQDLRMTIIPEFAGDITLTDADKIPEFVALGEKETEKHIDYLKRL